MTVRYKVTKPKQLGPYFRTNDKLKANYEKGPRTINDFCAAQSGFDRENTFK